MEIICIQNYLGSSQPSRIAYTCQNSPSKPSNLTEATEADACEAFARLFALAPEQKQMNPCW